MGDLRDALRGNAVPVTVQKMNSKFTNMKGVPVPPGAPSVPPIRAIDLCSAIKIIAVHYTVNIYDFFSFEGGG